MLHKSFLTIRLISFPLIPEVVKFNKENKYSEIRIVPVPSFPPIKSYSTFKGGSFWMLVPSSPTLFSELLPLPQSPSQIDSALYYGRVHVCGTPHSAKGSVRAWLSLVLFVSPTALN